MRSLVLLLTFFISLVAASAAEKPNIIYILADDLGYADLSCYGSKYHETPNLDRMAKEGMRFTSGYSCGPNCQPTRAALMSGQYGPRTGIYTVGSIDRFNWQSRPLRPVDNGKNLPAEKITIAQTLKNAGYKTAMFGKWHLGDGEFHPGKRGFDEAIESSGQHYDFETSPKTDYAKGTYLADFLTDKATDFIRRNKSEPFFLYLPHFGVHAPYQAKKELIEKFKNKPGVGGQKNPTYAAMLYSVDESVGRILSLLDELKLSENTLVIFASDNGGVGGYAREGIKDSDGATDNAHLRGGKGMLYEGGIRVPYIFRWTGKIASGATCETPINSVDLYPTLLELTGGQAPHDQPLDGVSYVKLLKNKGKGSLKREDLFWHFPGYLGAGGDKWRTTPAGAIRSGDWKLLEFFEDNRIELYNLRNDIGEQKNLAATEQKRANQLRDKLHTWRKSIGAPMPKPNVVETEKTDKSPKSLSEK